jgi:NADPH:quinone reductase-like Zn-dependent oxidoreductase
MRAAWYEKQGPARDVMVVGEMPDPSPGPGEVRIRIEASGINPGDIKKREDSFGVGMPYPRVIPHSDGAGRVDSGRRRRTFRLGRSAGLVLWRAVKFRNEALAREYCPPSPRIGI